MAVRHGDATTVLSAPAEEREWSVTPSIGGQTHCPAAAHFNAFRLMPPTLIHAIGLQKQCLQKRMKVTKR